MDANAVKELLSDNNIIELMLHLGSNYPQKQNNGYMFNSICHNHAGEGKYKLMYYSDSKSFFCFSNCGFIGSVFDLVSKVLDYDFLTSFKYVCSFFNINYSSNFNEYKDVRVDNSFINKFKDKKEEILLKEYDEEVLNNFNHLYHHTWIEDNITRETMIKFGIRYDILNNRIIIPHYNIEKKLIGIRCRNLNEEEVATGRKYMPITINKILYNYPTHANLFGLHINKEAIKKYKRVIIVESEKAVMQLYSFYGTECIAVACSGSFISLYQIQLLKSLGVETVILALDKEFSVIGEEDEINYRKKIKKSFVDKMAVYFNLQIIWDFDGRLDKKDSPTDKGKLIFEELLKDRLFL